MNPKQFIPLVFTGLAIPLGYFTGWCGVYSSCPFWVYFYDYVFTIFEPIYLFSLFSIPAVLLLPIVKERVFKTWLRFATVWIILSVIVIADTPTSINAWWSMFDFVREDAAKLMGILFSALSLFLLAWQTYMPKKIREAKL